MLAMATTMVRRKRQWATVLELERTELLVYNLPNDLIRGHDKVEDFCRTERRRGVL